MDNLHLVPFELKKDTLSIYEIPNGIKEIGAPLVWNEARFGEDIVIAVIDTGVDINHPDLTENIIGYYNFTTDDRGEPNKVIDYIGHGTHVAGILSAKLDSTGVVGVAPKSKTISLKSY